MPRDALFTEVYAELRALAGAQFRRQPDNHTLSPTALVHEVFLRLAGGRAPEDVEHFKAVAAKAMRHILVDRARRRRAAKRGQAPQRVTLDEATPNRAESAFDVLALDEVMARLEQADPRRARLVELRVFGGLTEQELADALGVSLRTVQSDWRAAKAWLVRELDRA